MEFVIHDGEGMYLADVQGRWTYDIAQALRFASKDEADRAANEKRENLESDAVFVREV